MTEGTSLQRRLSLPPQVADPPSQSPLGDRLYTQAPLRVCFWDTPPPPSTILRRRKQKLQKGKGTFPTSHSAAGPRGFALGRQLPTPYLPGEADEVPMSGVSNKESSPMQPSCPSHIHGSSCTVNEGHGHPRLAVGSRHKYGSARV